MFLFLLTYIRPLPEVERFLPEHIRYLDRQYRAGRFLCSGRKIPRTGGVILCNFPTREEAQKVMEQDPFFREGIARYELVEFALSKAAEGFQRLLQGLP